MPQISDQEYQGLLAKAQVADFVQPVYDNPKLSNRAKALLKEQYPHLQIPDFDMRQEMEGRFAAEDKRRADEEEKKKRDEEDAAWRAERKKVQDQYGFSDEKMGQMDKMMYERQIGNYEDAAALTAMREPKVSEPTYDSHFWRHERQDNFAEIAKDPEGWGRAEIMKALQADQRR
jgi:hypothetical protein